ncbi:MAG: TolC family protein [Fibrobacter sp.]|jgi:outer membrane protein TolC|nr:TolC family protein [Fibrobacter sp.]
MSFKWLFFFFLTIPVLAAEVRLDCPGFVTSALRQDPILAETRFSTEIKKNKIDELKADAFLSRFEFNMLVGPAPGLKESVDDWGDTVDTWDFTRMGPFFGTQVRAVQPLNYGQYVSGKKAAQADLRQQEMNVLDKENKKNVELQTYYFNYLLALEMTRLVQDAKRQMDKAYDQLEEALDEDKPGVSQMDLLQLKSGMHVIEEGVIDAEIALKQLQLATRFSLGLNESDTFFPLDTLLTVRSEALPSLEEAKLTAIGSHPELKRLNAGLEARSHQMDLAQAKLGPEFFIMGEFSYTKSWAGNRQAIQKNAFAQDAVNHISGAVGFGLRYRLNFWRTWESFRTARTEYRALRLTEKYASNGILLRLEEQYLNTEAQLKKVESLRSSLRASESILKGAAIQYDLDPSQTGPLVSAYRDNINLKKNYYYAVCKYNIAVAELIYRMGLSLEQFHSKYGSP